jgi:tetratricopeptide (TPR) repeat protein
MIETERRAHELDIVELTEDLPEFGLRRGERGTVVEAFDDPEEAYVLEFIDKSGSTSKLAFGITPDKLINVDSIAKEHYALGMRSLDSGDYVTAARELRKAVELIPSYVRGLQESFRRALVPIEDWPRLIPAMQFVILLEPNYTLAKYNLAIAFLNCGAQQANQGNYLEALHLFQSALRVEAQGEVFSLTTDNISTTHSALARKAYKQNDILTACKHFEAAYTFKRDVRTRHDLALIYFYVGDYYLNNNDAVNASAYYQWAQDSGLITPEVLNNHGVARAVKGDFDGAIVLLESALALAPADETLRANLFRASVSRSASELVTEQTDNEFNPVPALQFAGLSASI